MLRVLTPIALGLLFSACAEPEPRAVLPGDLLISQLYMTGAVPSGGTERYFSDQFIELVNTTGDPLDLSGLRIGDVYGAAGEINPGMQPDSFRERRPDEVVMSSVWRFPDGAHVDPGMTVAIAHDGTNHRPFSDVDLSAAAFETYVGDSERDDDHPTVPNMESVVYNGGFDWLLTVFGPSVVLFDATTELSEVAGARALPAVPISAVFDGVETLMDEDSAAFKRLPDAIDSGFAWSDGPYTGVSLHRRATDGEWQDTNDSSADFERGEPMLTQVLTEGQVTGTPTVQLGTGTAAYETLEEGDTIELVAGIQGGWHVDATVACEGVEPDGVTLAYDAVSVEGERVSFTTQALLASESVLDTEPGWQRVGDRIVFDIGDPSDVVGQTVIVRVTATLGQASWSDELSVVVADDDPQAHP